MCIRDEALVTRLQDQVDRLQQEKLELLRDWAESQNVFVKSVRNLEVKVAERDLRIEELLNNSYKETTQ